MREVASRLGELLDRPPRFTESEAATALLGNAAKACDVLGTPAVPLETMLRWTAHWVQAGGRSLDRPTRFEVRDGSY